MLFRDLKRFVDNQVELKLESQSEQFAALKGLPFWIWDQQEHRKADIITNGFCCFNHTLGLPTKEGIDKPLFDYEKIIFDSLITANNKHIWIKKSNWFRRIRVYAQVYGLALFKG